MFNYLYTKAAQLGKFTLQDHLLPQLGKYLAQAHILDQKRGIKDQRRDRHFIEKITGSEGHCSGFTPMVLYSLWLRFQPVNEQESSQRDDYDWLNDVFKRLAGWNGDINKLSVRDGEDFDRLTSHIEFFQNIDDYLTDASHGDLSRSIEDTKKTKIKHEYSLGGMFTVEDIASMLPEIIKDDRLLLITSHNHATGIFKHGDDIFLYNSNKLLGLHTFKLSRDQPFKNREVFHSIAKTIHKANAEKNELFCPLGFRSFAIGSVQPEKYPAQHHLLDSTYLMNPKNKLDINFSSAKSDNYTGLMMAVDVGDEVSVKFYLSRGADPLAVGKKNVTAFELAAKGGHAGVLKLLLMQAAQNENFTLDNDHLVEALSRLARKDFPVAASVMANFFLEAKPYQFSPIPSRFIEGLIPLVAKLPDETVLEVIKKGLEMNSITFEQLKKTHLYYIVNRCDEKRINAFIGLARSMQQNPSEMRTFCLDAFHHAIEADRIDILPMLIKELYDFHMTLDEILNSKNSEGRNAFQLSLTAKGGNKVLLGLIKMMETQSFLQPDHCRKMLTEKDSHQFNIYQLAANNLYGVENLRTLNELFLPTFAKEVKIALTEQTENGYNALYLAVISGDKEAITLLANTAKKMENTKLEEDAKEAFLGQIITAKGSFDNSILHAAINRGNVDILETVLNIANEDVDVFNTLMKMTNAAQNNCFHYAISKNEINLEIVKKLFEKSNNELTKLLLTSKNENNLTPIDVAEQALRAHPEKNKEALDFFRSEVKKLGLQATTSSQPQLKKMS